LFAERPFTLRLILFLFVAFLGADAGAVDGLEGKEDTISPSAGFYNRAVEVSLPPGAHYTQDGSTPTAKSPAYENPVYVDRTTVVRYANFDDEGKQVGFVYGATYFIGEPETRLLTMSIGVDPWRLFDGTNGWFRAGPGADPGHWKKPGANWWTRREHPVHLDLLEADGKAVHSSTVGFRMFGGMSRLHPQKSFSLSARKSYGKKRIKHRLFGEEGPKSFQFLVARNSGSDWNRSYLRDALLTDLLQNDSWDLDHQAARPIQVYINGKYWGVYHLREKINPQFIADRHDIDDKETIDLLEHQQTVKHGRIADYRNLLRFVETHDLSVPDNYRQLGEEMDIANYQRLQIAQTYFDNRDAGGNIRYWRDRSAPASKWRWILYDVDQGFGLHSDSAYQRNTLEFYTEANGPSWPNPPWSTFLQRKLLTNDDYRTSFVNRSLDYLATDFSPGNVKIAIQRRVTELKYDMPRQLKRWKGKAKHWELHLDRLRNFASQRPIHFREHLRAFFAGGADVSVTVIASPGGYIELNHNLTIDEESFAGSYFQNHPLHLRAAAHLGFKFVGWEGGSSDPLQKINLKDGRSANWKALFEPVENPLAGQLVLNEICPRSKSSGDWVEIHNRSAETVDLTGWQLSDGAHQIHLPGTRISGGDYLVICRDLVRFQQVYPSAHNVVGGLDFGLDKKNETLGLYDADGAFINQISYTVNQPDSSFVLALIRTDLDNKNPANWTSIPGYGTPCAANPEELKTTVLSTQDYWLRIGIGLGFLGLVVLLRVMRGGRATEE
jgi:hypothetical protein